MTTPLKAIVLAGGAAKPAFVAATGVTNRALVELTHGKTMLQFVVDSLKGSANIGEIFVVGDVPDQPGITLVPSGASLIDNILAGMNAATASESDRLLLVSSDIPFIKPAEIDDYVDKALLSGADFCYPIIPMVDYNRQFAEMKRTTLKLREGEFTGGNIMLVRAEVILQNPGSIHKAYAARKSVPALGGMLGWGLLARIVFSQLVAPNMLNIPLLEGAIGKLLGGGVQARAIITTSPSIGTDIDAPDDVAIARRILGA